jgi:hypothetical protein
LRPFLVSEIEAFGARVDLSVQFNELKVLLHRVMLLNSAIFYAVNKLLIRTSIQQYLFQEVAKCDERLWEFIDTSRRPFSEFTASVIGAFWALLATEYPSSQSPARAEYSKLLKSTMSCELVNHIRVDEFMQIERVRSAFQLTIVTEQWKPLTPLIARARDYFRSKILRAGKEMLAMKPCPFVKVLNLALRAVDVIASVVPREAGNRGEFIERGVAWCLANCGKKAVGMRFLIVWGFFGDWFFARGENLLDIVGTQRNELGLFRSAFQAHCSWTE